MSRPWIAHLLALALLAAGLIYLASLRLVGGYGVETDFYGAFIPEARRFLDGAPMLVEWHPPFYSMLLGAFHVVMGDWFHTGLAISICSGLIAVAAAFALFRNLLGNSYGIAAALALLVWPDFIPYSVTAGTDIPFLALMLLGLAIASQASKWIVFRGVLAGFVAGLASLTRTNGVVLVLLPLFYASHYPAPHRLRAGVSTACGFLFPWCLWLGLATMTESPILPHKTYIDIAVAFFGEPGSTSSSNEDNWRPAEESFSSLADVVLHDPPALAGGVVRNSLAHGWSLFRNLSSWLPLVAAASAVSLTLLLVQKRLWSLWLLVLIFAAQYGILCLRSFGSRYYLFLIPLVGVGLFAALGYALRRATPLPRARAAMMLLATGTLIIFLGSGAADRFSYLRHNEARDALAAASAIPSLHGDPRYRVVARKPHFAFHANLYGEGFPPVATLEDLKSYLCRDAGERPTLLFFGSEEAARRPSIRHLQSPETAPDWLVPIAHEPSDPCTWTLYEVRCVD